LSVVVVGNMWFYVEISNIALDSENILEQ